MEPTYNFVNDVKRFMETGGQTVDLFSPEQSCLYMGLQLEELVEKLVAIKGASVTKDAADRFDLVIEPMRELCDEFKRGMHRGNIMRADAEELLDGDIDLAVVSIGAALSFSNDAVGAANEVMRANLAKFPGGKALRDENGKIRKPPGWTPPNLAPYVRRD